MSNTNNCSFKAGKITRNPFFNFLREYRTQQSGNISICEIARQAAQIWKGMDSEQRQPYVLQATSAPKIARKSKVRITCCCGKCGKHGNRSSKRRHSSGGKKKRESRKGCGKQKRPRCVSSRKSVKSRHSGKRKGRKASCGGRKRSRSVKHSKKRGRSGCSSRSARSSNW